MKITDLQNKNIIFEIVDSDCESFEVKDMYWFEENGFHNNSDSDFRGYKLVGIRFEDIK